MAEAPRVTGLSPNQGPPGTRVTIRGQNLGHNASDVVDLTICGYNCVSWAEWKSPMKILCRTGPGVGKGEIIVTTRSGGEGTCTVTFRGYMEKIGPTEVSAVWIDEPDLEGKDKLHMLKPRDPLGYDHVLEIPSTEDELEELYPDGTGELTSENFIAAWYLLEYHRNTSFSELQEGLKHLRHEVAQRKRGPIAFVKRNINTFIDCHDTLTAVHQMLLESESKSEGGSITYKLETIVEEAGDSADKLFATVLRRKDRADATRNALSVLQRFRYFFSLPRTIERNIEQEEYEVVINGYENAKSLIQDKEVQAFKRVLEEVESLVGKCRDKLRMKLEENPSTLGERKRLIRYMVELGCEGNPAWDCLLSQHRWITKLIEKCKTDYQPQKDERAATDDGETGTHGRAHAMSFNSTGSKGSGSGSLSPQRMLSFSRGSSLGRTGSAIWCKVESSMPIRIQFIEELCDLMSAPQSIPDLWQLAQAYFSENLVENLIVTADTLQEQEEKCNSMLQSLLNYFADLLRLTFFPTYWDEMSEDQHAQLGSWTPFKETKQEAAGAWLPFCVRHVRSCFSSLSRLQLPREVLNSFRQFVVDLRLHCTKRLFEQSIKDINGLKAREDWHTEIDECGCITSLPVLFENICMEVLLGVKEVVIDSKPGENSRSYHVQALQREAAEQLTECFHVFVDVLDALAFYQESGGPTHRGGPSPYVVFPSTETLDVDEDDYTPTREKQLLIALSNCRYTSIQVLPKVVEIFKSHGYAEYSIVAETARSFLEELDTKINTVYVESKELPIVGAVEPGMTAGEWDWEECPAPTEVRGYVKETLLKLVKVHAEVYSVIPPFVGRILSHIVEAVIAEITRVLQCSSGFSENGTVQARLELTAIEKALSKCLSSRARVHIGEAFSFLPHLNNSEKIKIMDLQVKAFLQRMKFQLACFSGVTVTEPR